MAMEAKDRHLLADIQKTRGAVEIPVFAVVRMQNENPAYHTTITGNIRGSRTGRRAIIAAELI